MFIRSLTLRNILSFRDPVLLPLLPLNIFIGANGSGKSNLIDASDSSGPFPPVRSSTLMIEAARKAGSGEGLRVAMGTQQSRLNSN